MTPRTLVLRTAGTNCEQELAHAFERAGSEVELIHFNRLIERPGQLAHFDLIGFPGGFSYGDDIAAGQIYAHRLRHLLYPALRNFTAEGKLIIGICNGFQVLVKCGLLPGFELPADQPPPQLATLTDNATPRFTDRWVGLRAESTSRCIWTRGLERFDLPIAHGEGRFLAEPDVLDRLEQGGQIALRYADNPNGSARDIAGICDPTGRVFGLMPHPERFTEATHHPDWTRTTITDPAGLSIFKQAVQYAASRSAPTAVAHGN